jgi:hypothetical protein
MFTAPPQTIFDRPLRSPGQAAGAPVGQRLRAGGILRGLASMGLIAMGFPGALSAQALGTMQIAARVVPASVAWTGLAEARIAARSVAEGQSGLALTRRGRLVHATAEIHPSSGRADDRRRLIITIQHPHN